MLVETAISTLSVVSLRNSRYTGLVTNDDGSQNTHKKGFLEFKDKNMQSHAVELEEFCILAEVDENKEYLFSLYSRTKDLLFTAVFSGLEDVDFIVENGSVDVIKKGHGENGVKDENKCIGQTFGKLTAIKPIGKTSRGKEWLFQCSCGNTIEAALGQVKAGKAKSCGCLRSKDIAGQKFGRLTATKQLEKKSKSGCYRWECVCDCGRTATPTIGELNSGNTISCGCFQKDITAKATPHMRKHLILAEGTNVSNIASDKINANNKSGIKGVCWDKCRNKWKAYINFQETHHLLGHFDDIEDAVLARKKGEEKYFKPIIEKYMEAGNSDSEMNYVDNLTLRITPACISHILSWQKVLKRKKYSPKLKNINSLSTGESKKKKTKNARWKLYLPDEPQPSGETP